VLLFLYDKSRIVLTAVNRYLILDRLGDGRFSQVAKCQNMKTHEIVAVKVVKNKPACFNQSMMEVTILELVRNDPSLTRVPSYSWPCS
jgi:serine/threonine protein kinase